MPCNPVPIDSTLVNPLTDTEIRTRLTGVDRALLDSCSDATVQLRRASDDQRELVTWVEPKQAAENAWTFGYPNYARIVTDLFAAVHALTDAAGLDELWLEPSHLPKSAATVEELTLIDALAYIVTVWHGERISDGLIASCLENGTLLAAATRVAAALRPID